MSSHKFDFSDLATVGLDVHTAGLMSKADLSSKHLGTPGFDSHFYRGQALHLAFDDLIEKKNAGTIGANEFVNRMLAFYLLIGSTHMAKQYPRMIMYLGDLPRVNGVEEELPMLTRRLGERSAKRGADFNEQRLASGFPDIQASFRASVDGDVVNKNMTDFFGYNAAGETNAKITAPHFPGILAYSNSIQLNLDTTAQKYADAYNLHYWCRVQDGQKELDRGGDFVYAYFLTSRQDKYELFFVKDAFEADFNFSKHLAAPYSISTLMAYHSVTYMAAQGLLTMPDPKKTDGTTLPAKLISNAHFTTELSKYSDANLAALISDIGAFTVPQSDANRDGSKVEIPSTSSQYKIELSNRSKTNTSAQKAAAGRALTAARPRAQIAYVE